MNDNQTEVILRENLRIPTWFKIAVVPLVGIAVILSIYVYYVSHKQYPALPVTSFVVSDELKARADMYMEADKNLAQQQVRAQALILPLPINTNASDTAAYLEATKGLTSELRAEVASDVVANAFVIEGSTFGDYVTQDAAAEKYQTLFTGLHALVAKLHTQYQRPPLSKRITGVEVIGTPADDTVYPNTRVADGYLAAAIATMVDSDTALVNAHTADTFARRGVMYGWYGESDIEATKKLVDEYVSTINLKEYIAKQNVASPGN